MYSDRVCVKLSVSKIKRIVYNGHNEVGVGGGGGGGKKRFNCILNLFESVSDFEYFSLNLGL